MPSARITRHGQGSEKAGKNNSTMKSVFYITHIIGFNSISGVDSQTKYKFCTNTESCMVYEEWEATTAT